MSDYLLPTDEQFVETIAMAIARNRLQKEASSALEEMVGLKIDSNPILEESFDRVFDLLWKGQLPEDMRQKDAYREDARVAIAAINLKLLTTT